MQVTKHTTNCTRTISMLRPTHLHEEDLVLSSVKSQHERLKKRYGYLWKSLGKDPAVIQEYQSLLMLLQKPAVDAVEPISNVVAQIDEGNKKKESTASCILSSSSLSSSSKATQYDNDSTSQSRGHVQNVQSNNTSDFKEINKENRASHQNVVQSNTIDFLTGLDSRRAVQFQIMSHCCNASNGCDGISCTAPIVDDTIEEIEHQSSDGSVSPRADMLPMRNFRPYDDDDDESTSSSQSETQSDDVTSFFVMENHEKLHDTKRESFCKDIDLGLSTLNLHNDSIDDGEEADDENIKTKHYIGDDDLSRENDDGNEQEEKEKLPMTNHIRLGSYRKSSNVRGEKKASFNHNVRDGLAFSRSESESTSSDDETVTFTLNHESFISAGITIVDDDKDDGSGSSRSSEDAEWSENHGSKWIPEQDSDSDKHTFDSENKINIVQDSDDSSYEDASSNYDETCSTESEGNDFEKENRMYGFESNGSTSGYVKGKDVNARDEKWSKRRSIPSSKIHEPDKSQKRTNLKGNNHGGKLNFKRNKEIIARETFDEFDNLIFRNKLKGVEVQWSSRLVKTAGITRLKRYKKGDSVDVVRTATIELSTKLIDCEDRLRSTLCHEMCHAAQWLVDGVSKPPHGSCFKKWASLAMRKINGMLVTTTHDYVTNTFKFAWACSTQGCPVIIQRHSRSLDPNRHCCGKCKGRFIEIEVSESNQDISNNGYTPKKKRNASGFSLFVQNNSAQVRKNLEDLNGGAGKVSQKEVMKECARLWRINTTNST